MTNSNSNSNSNSTATATPHPVTWFEIHTADPVRAKKFYGSVLGWTFDDESMPGYTMIGLGDEAPIGGGLVDTSGDVDIEGLVETIRCTLSPRH